MNADRICGFVQPTCGILVGIHIILRQDYCACHGLKFSVQLQSQGYQRSGVEGLSGISSDMRDIDDAYDAGNPRAIVARDLYYDRVRQYIGKYAALMGGVDMIIFTGGVGENSWDLRARATMGLEFMGVEINDAVNRPTRGTDTIISTENSRVKVAVIATNEELVIATDTYNLTK